MASTSVTRTLDTTPERLWRCIRAFGDLSWVPGDPEVAVRGEGVGQLRIVERPGGAVHEQLTALDDAARTLSYVVPQGNPVPVRDYEARMRVDDDGGRGRLTWSSTFEPDGVSEEEAAADLGRRYAGAMKVMEAYLKAAEG